jgi:hypothetical protein
MAMAVTTEVVAAIEDWHMTALTHEALDQKTVLLRAFTILLSQINAPWRVDAQNSGSTRPEGIRCVSAGHTNLPCGALEARRAGIRGAIALSRRQSEDAPLTTGRDGEY